MKIYQKLEGEASQFFFLSTRRCFKTIVELVSFYERNDLGENFAGYEMIICDKRFEKFMIFWFSA